MATVKVSLPVAVPYPSAVLRRALAGTNALHAAPEAVAVLWPVLCEVLYPELN